MYFNEGMIGSGHAWSDLVSRVEQAKHCVSVLFVPAVTADGRYQARGVVSLTDKQRRDIDSNGDGIVSRPEMLQFLKQHPEISVSVLLTRRENEQKKRRQTFQSPSPQKKRRTDDGANNLEDVYVGVVKNLILSRDPPFGFIRPDKGDADIYFNEWMLGSGHEWTELVSRVEEARHPVSVIFVPAASVDGRMHARGVVALTAKQRSDLDANGDGAVSRSEMLHFLKLHPDISVSVLLTKGDAERQEKSRERDLLYQRQEAAEHELHRQREQENKRAVDLRALAKDLRQQGKHQEAADLEKEAKQCSQRAYKLKLQVAALDWKNNESMFEHVMQNGHEGRMQDGSWVDLHGLSADFAAHKVQEVLDAARKANVKSVEIITGAGRGSGAAGPKIKPRILTLLIEQAHLGKLSYTEMPHGGSFLVTLLSK